MRIQTDDVNPQSPPVSLSLGPGQPEPVAVSRSLGFELGAARGEVRPVDELHGIYLWPAGRAGSPIGCLLNLEHFSASGRAGLFVPRQECQRSWSVTDGSVRLSFAPTATWGVETTIVYAVWSDGIRASFTFRFERAYRQFEAFVASYVEPGSPPPLIPRRGGWSRPRIAPGEQLFISRDVQARTNVKDGRWDGLPGRGLAVRAAREPYAQPLMVSARRRGGWGIVQMAHGRLCPSLSPNRRWGAHDLALVGRDVEAGDVVTVPVWLVVSARPDPMVAEAAYETFLHTEVADGPTD